MRDNSKIRELWSNADKTPYAQRPAWPWHSSHPLAGWVAFLVADENYSGGYRQEWTQNAEELIDKYQGAADVRMTWNTFYSPWNYLDRENSGAKAKNVLNYMCCFFYIIYIVNNSAAKKQNHFRNEILFISLIKYFAVF